MVIPITRTIWQVRPGSWKGSVTFGETTVLYELMMTPLPQMVTMFTLHRAGDGQSIPVTNDERAFFLRMALPLALRFCDDGEGKIPVVRELCGAELARTLSSPRKLTREDVFDLSGATLQIFCDTKFGPTQVIQLDAPAQEVLEEFTD